MLYHLAYGESTEKPSQRGLIQRCRFLVTLWAVQHVMEEAQDS